MCWRSSPRHTHCPFEIFIPDLCDIRCATIPCSSQCSAVIRQTRRMWGKCIMWSYVPTCPLSSKSSIKSSRTSMWRSTSVYTTATTSPRSIGCLCASRPVTSATSPPPPDPRPPTLSSPLSTQLVVFLDPLTASGPINSRQSWRVRERVQKKSTCSCTLSCTILPTSWCSMVSRARSANLYSISQPFCTVCCSDTQFSALSLPRHLSSLRRARPPPFPLLHGPPLALLRLPTLMFSSPPYQNGWANFPIFSVSTPIGETIFCPCVGLRPCCGALHHP
mmetsp:Transcript_44805/g.72962  ORF Transcript_44805/g.72962 Transcript_44805/m.72962 type:complete len:277 (+) Transcript_44805:4355-5185(+)